MPLDFSPASSFMKEPVRSMLWAHPGTMARDGFLLSFFCILSLSLSLLSAYTESPSSPLCVTVNHERARGPGRPRERRRSGRGGGGEGGREGSGEWRGNKGRRREGRCRETAAQPRLPTPLYLPSISFSSLLYSLSLSFSFPSPSRSFLTLDLFRASTIYLQASNKKK